MSKETVFTSLRAAFSQAQVGTDAFIDFAESSDVIAGVLVHQLRVSYQRGNEYIRLDSLLSALGRVGKVDVFEYRGRGRNELPSLVADVLAGGERYRLMYALT